MPPTSTRALASRKSRCKLSPTQASVACASPRRSAEKGYGPRTFVACVEELARACPSTAMVYVMHVTASQSVAASNRF
jgi:hypothetical protein